MSVNEPQRFAADVARRAHAVFRQEGWTYGPTPNRPERRIPTIAELEGAVLRQMRDVPPGHSVSQGRITIWRDEDDGVETLTATLGLGSLELPEASS